MTTTISGPLEAKVESKVTHFARKRGCMVVKLTPQGVRGWPDCLLLGPDGRVLFIEFKRRGKVARALQHAVHRRLRKLGHRVEVIDCADAGCNAVRQWLDA